MDEEDEKWLNAFNAKAEGASGGAGTETVSSPLRETSGHNQPLSAGRERRIKGKDREREKDAPLTSLSISEDIFEYVMGMLEKYAEDTIPMLHTVSLVLLEHILEWI
jgi:enhancer of polycomb-like protein